MSGESFKGFAAALDRVAAARRDGRRAVRDGDVAAAQAASDRQQSAAVEMIQLREDAEREVAAAGLTLAGALSDSLVREFLARGTPDCDLAALTVVEVGREHGLALA